MLAACLYRGFLGDFTKLGERITFLLFDLYIEVDGLALDLLLIVFIHNPSLKGAAVHKQLKPIVSLQDPKHVVFNFVAEFELHVQEFLLLVYFSLVV